MDPTVTTTTTITRDGRRDNHVTAQSHHQLTRQVTDPTVTTTTTITRDS